MIPRRVRKSRKRKRKRTRPAPTASASAHATAGPATTRINFEEVSDLAEVTRDEVHVSALFVECGKCAAYERTLYYTAYADYPAGRVLLTATDRLSYTEKFVTGDKRVKDAIEHWKKQGISIYGGRIKME